MIQPLDASKTVGAGYHESYRASMLDRQMLSTKVGGKQCPPSVVHR